MDIPDESWLTSTVNSHILALLGIVFLCKILIEIYYGILWFISVYAPSLYRPYNYITRYGEWAAITGCTSGIGLALAKEIARRGINLVLISRSKEKLNSLANQIENEFKVKTKILINDATVRQNTNEMGKELAKMDIGILVNNVGINFTSLNNYHLACPSSICEMLTVNTGNSVIAMRYVLPEMIKSSKGVVINVCSAGAYTPLPLQTLYCSTKIYLDILSKALRRELKSRGVKLQSICPLLVQSNMTRDSSHLIHKFASISSEKYAISVINSLCTKERTAGYWVFDIFVGMFNILLSKTLFVYLIFYGTEAIKLLNNNLF